MRPITYAGQCHACHPLYYDPTAGGRTFEADSAEVIPHGLTPEQIREFLHNVYARKYLSMNPGLLERDLPQGPLPSEPLEPRTELARQWIGARVAESQRHLSMKICPSAIAFKPRRKQT